MDKHLRDFLFQTFDKNYIYNFGRYLYELAEDFLSDSKLTGKVSIDKNSFLYCVIDILIDIARLKDFHDIANISKIKYRAYCASWWIRRKPLLYKTNSANADTWINERFALSVLLQALDKNLYTSDSYNSQKAHEVAKTAFYHLKYRDVSPQTLELFLIGLNAVN